MRLGLGLAMTKAQGSGGFSGLDWQIANGLWAENSGYAAGNPTGFSFTRTGAGTAQTSGGNLSSYATDAPRLVTGRGLLLEGARTNKSSGPNANLTTTAGITTYGDAARVFSVVSDTAALSAAGLSSVCTSGNVFRLNNTAGGTPAYAVMNGTVGNLNQHIQSIWARGSGNYSVGLDAGVDSGNIPTGALTSSYVRRNGTAGSLPTVTGAALRVAANAGADVYFILWQLEEASAVGSVIVTSGSQATRGEDEPRLTVPANCNAYIIDYEGGQLTGSVTPSSTFDFSASALSTLGGKYITRVRLTP